MDTSHTRQLSQSAFNRSHGSFELVLGPAFFALFGLWLDRQLGVTPLLTIVLAFLGMMAAFAKQYYTYRAEMDAERAKRAGAGLP